MSSPISTRRLCSLTTPELFVLCSLRLILPTARDGRDIGAHCREGFEIARLNVTHAQHLAAAVGVMDTGMGRPLDVRETTCAEVSQDEDLVLQVLLLLQHENEFGARRVLWKDFPPATARIVITHLDEVALGMVRAGLLLPPFPYALRPCPAEALAARRLGASLDPAVAEAFWLN
jgi:hypothetical protein